MTTPTTAQAGLPELPAPDTLVTNDGAAWTAASNHEMVGQADCTSYYTAEQMREYAFAAVRAAQAAQPTATVDEAIAALAVALKSSKGWLHDYADAVIRDAIFCPSVSPTHLE